MRTGWKNSGYPENNSEQFSTPVETFATYPEPMHN